MKKNVMLVMATAFMFSVATFAQNQTPQQGKKSEKKEFKQGDKSLLSPEMKADKMAKDLGLTDAQKLKVQALFEKQNVKRTQHQAEVKKIREDQKAKLDADRKSMDEELLNIIGKEKFQQLESKRTELKAKRDGRREGNQRVRFERAKRMKEFRHADRPKISAQDRADRMAKQLTLTDAEKTQVQALFEKQDANLEKHLAELNKMKDDQMAQMDANRKTQDAEIENVIGKEKFQTLQTRRSEMMGKMKDGKSGNRNMPPRERMEMRNHMQGNMLPSPEKRAERMAKILSLSDAQKAGLQAVFVKQDAERVQHLSDLKKFRDDQKAKFEALKKAQDADLQKIIGTEKFQKLESLRAEKQEKMKMQKMKHRGEKTPNDSTMHHEMTSNQM